jgi:hypothetical protein
MLDLMNDLRHSDPLQSEVKRNPYRVVSTRNSRSSRITSKVLKTHVRGCFYPELPVTFANSLFVEAAHQ